MPDIATLSDEFQIAIPEAILEAQRWHSGQQFALIPKGRGVLLIPVPSMEELRGIAKGADTSGYRDREDRY